MSVFPPVCKYHTEHVCGCMFCEAFDKAATEYFSSYVLPPQAHPAVVKLKVEAWMLEMFPPCDDT